jgi:hypothetical protein
MTLKLGGQTTELTDSHLLDAMCLNGWRCYFSYDQWKVVVDTCAVTGDTAREALVQAYGLRQKAMLLLGVRE